MINDIDYVVEQLSSKKGKEQGYVYRGEIKDGSIVHVFNRNGSTVFEHSRDGEIISCDNTIKGDFLCVDFTLIHPFKRSQLENISLSDVLTSIRQYPFIYKATRSEWNGGYIYMQKGSMISTDNVRNRHMASENNISEYITIRPHIDKVNIDGTITVGWSPSQDDMFEDDWKLFE